MRRFLVLGFVIWLGATIVLRFAGQFLLRPEQPVAIVLLFAASLPAMAWVARRICNDRSVAPADRPLAGVMLVLPALLLDTFASAFFPYTYPNLPAAAAGLFGGWMLWCCAGALLGVLPSREAGEAREKGLRL